jgi:hypothetical protein
LIELAEVFALFAGETMATTGGGSVKMVSDADPDPNWFVQVTTTVKLPRVRVTELVVVLVDATPFTVQVVPTGIVVPPSTV